MFLQDLSMLDLGFGFLVKHCVYSGLESLETSNLVNKYPNLVLKKFLFKPDQWVIGPLMSPTKGM